MPQFMLSDHDFQNSNVPQPLEPYVNVLQWTEISHRIRKASSDTTSLLCLMEWAICLIFCFFCIFFCHGCFYDTLYEEAKLNAVNDLNRRLFAGQSVLQKIGDKVVVDTDLLQPTYVTVTSVNAPVNPVYDPELAIPSAQLARTMQVQIPPSAEPGSVLTVQAADGSFVKVTVPYNAVPGSVVTVAY